MNKTFKVIWNHAAQNWVAVSELNKAKGKTKSLSLAKKGLFKFSLISSALALVSGQAMAITGSNSCSYDANTKELVCGDSASSATGNAAIAIGSQVTANGEAAVVIGRAANAGAAQSIAIGDKAMATQPNNIAMGQKATASGKQSVAIGDTSVASGNNAVSLGSSTKATASGSVALGNGASSTNANAVALGDYAKASGSNSVAIGQDSKATGGDTIAIGRDTTAQDTNDIAIGINSKVYGGTSVALGNGNTVNGSYSNAIGYQNTVDANYASVLGFWNKIVNQKPAKDVSGAFGQGNQIFNSGSSYAFGLDNIIGSTTNSIENGLALGRGNSILGSASIGIGGGATVGARESNAIGRYNIISSSSEFSTAIGSVIRVGASDATVNKDSNGNHNVVYQNQTAAAYTVAIGHRIQVSNGSNSIAVGRNTTVNASDSIAMGTNAVSNTANSVVIGANAKDTTNMGYSQATAVGYNTTAANDSVALGSGASATGHITNTTFSGWATAVGRLSNASGRGGIAVGNEAAASGIDSAAFGSYANASNDYAYSLGFRSRASGESSIAFGYWANANATSSIAIGHTAQGIDESAVAVGLTSWARGKESLALGAHAQANHSKDVALGAYSSTETAVGTTSARVNNITYGNFCGTDPVATVSVGSTNEKRTITNVAAGRISNVSTDAINGSQLYWVANNLADEIAKVKKMTWNATASQNGGTATGITNATVNNGDTVTFEAGKNITITQDGRKFTIEATGSGSTTNVVVDAGEGIQVNSTTNGNNVTYTVTAKTDGTTIKIDNNGNISAVTTDLNVVGGKVEEPTGSNASALVNATTVTKAINNSGFTLKTSATSEGQKEASSTGEELITPGKAVEMVAGKNLTVKQSANGTITYATKDDVNFNSVTVGNTTITHDGVRITGGPSITTNGVDAGNKKITNVAPGEISATSKDAVNGSQLYAVGNNINNLNNRVNKIDKDLRAGIAGAAAIAGLPQVRGNGKSMMAVAASNYRGENAVALGYTRASDNGKVLLKLSGSTNTRGDVVSAVGLGYEW